MGVHSEWSDPSFSLNEMVTKQKVIIEDQERLIDMLRTELAAYHLQDEFEEMAEAWAKKLTPQEAAFMNALLFAYPRSVNHYAMLEMLPSYDRVGALDRQSQIVKVVACKVRKKLGKDAVDTIRGVGFRMSDSFYAAIRPDSNRVIKLKAA